MECQNWEVLESEYNKNYDPLCENEGDYICSNCNNEICEELEDC